MINLKNSGLPLSWDGEKKSMDFKESLGDVKPAVRRLEDMQDVLYDKRVLNSRDTDLKKGLYYMYRGVSFPEVEEKFKTNNIRYDITVLVPGAIGREYIKTAGHYHPSNAKQGASSTYPEVYEVLYGRAYYLMQKPYALLDPLAGLEEIIVVEARAGDKVLVPPNFGHVTINPDDDYLVMSNLVAASFSSIYEPIKAMQGAGYFCLVNSGDPASPEFVPNNNYSKLPPLQRGTIADFPSFKINTKGSLPLYQAFLENPADFAFLA